MDWTAFRSSRNFYNIFWIIFLHIYDTAEVTSSVATYLQFENIHITFVIGINIRTVVMARPKSFLRLYTSTNMPITVLQQHTVTVII